MIPTEKKLKSVAIITGVTKSNPSLPVPFPIHCSYNPPPQHFNYNFYPPPPHMVPYMPRPNFPPVMIPHYAPPPFYNTAYGYPYIHRPSITGSSSNDNNDTNIKNNNFATDPTRNDKKIKNHDKVSEYISDEKNKHSKDLKRKLSSPDRCRNMTEFRGGRSDVDARKSFHRSRSPPYFSRSPRHLHSNSIRKQSYTNTFHKFFPHSSSHHRSHEKDDKYKFKASSHNTGAVMRRSAKLEQETLLLMSTLEEQSSEGSTYEVDELSDRNSSRDPGRLMKSLKKQHLLTKLPARYKPIASDNKMDFEAVKKNESENEIKRKRYGRGNNSYHTNGGSILKLEGQLSRNFTNRNTVPLSISKHESSKQCEVLEFKATESKRIKKSHLREDNHKFNKFNFRNPCRHERTTGGKGLEKDLPLPLKACDDRNAEGEISYESLLSSTEIEISNFIKNTLPANQKESKMEIDVPGDNFENKSLKMANEIQVSRDDSSFIEGHRNSRLSYGQTGYILESCDDNAVINVLSNNVLKIGNESNVFHILDSVEVSEDELDDIIQFSQKEANYTFPFNSFNITKEAGGSEDLIGDIRLTSDSQSNSSFTKITGQRSIRERCPFKEDILAPMNAIVSTNNIIPEITKTSYTSKWHNKNFPPKSAKNIYKLDNRITNKQPTNHPTLESDLKYLPQPSLDVTGQIDMLNDEKILPKNLKDNFLFERDQETKVYQDSSSEGEAGSLNEDMDQYMEDEEIFNMLEQPVDKAIGPLVYEKSVMKAVDKDDFEVLPDKWIEVTHNSGIPIYLNRMTRVCTLARPYFLGSASVRKHSVPLGGIPCLLYQRFKERQSNEIDLLEKYNAENISKTSTHGNNDVPDQEFLQNISDDRASIRNLPRNLNDNIISDLIKVTVESAEQIKERHWIAPAQLRQYCEKLFDFQTITVRRFKTWADRRRHIKKVKSQRPSLPKSAKIVKCILPTQKYNGQIVAKKKNFYFNPEDKTVLSILHEYVQNVLKTQVSYTFHTVENSNTPFSARLSIKGLEYGIGYGSNKKNAKLDAARVALSVLNPEIASLYEKSKNLPPLNLITKDECKEDDLNFMGGAHIKILENTDKNEVTTNNQLLGLDKKASLFQNIGKKNCFPIVDQINRNANLDSDNRQPHKFTHARDNKNSINYESDNQLIDSADLNDALPSNNFDKNYKEMMDKISDDTGGNFSDERSIKSQSSFLLSNAKTEIFTPNSGGLNEINQKNLFNNNTDNIDEDYPMETKCDKKGAGNHQYLFHDAKDNIHELFDDNFKTENSENRANYLLPKIITSESPIGEDIEEVQLLLKQFEEFSRVENYAEIKADVGDRSCLYATNMDLFDKYEQPIKENVTGNLGVPNIYASDQSQALNIIKEEDNTHSEKLCKRPTTVEKKVTPTFFATTSDRDDGKRDYKEPNNISISSNTLRSSIESQTQPEPKYRSNTQPC
ncbi:uncharacterized protein LOC135925775 isoform X2 [Gordionus sp. m RMFG-2023]|uniref:uncharacterized protein LOC135925775 isoform X2 n=1 Tax=Gordionus sp. m RMFG-2023 TaxID=3053472 RepID=UPI0031FD3560